MKALFKGNQRKGLSLLFALALLLGLLTGCSPGENGETENENQKDLPTIGIIQYVEHLSLDTIRQSILDELAAQGFVDGETVTIDYQNGQGETNNLKSITQKFAAKEYDLIIAIATPAAQAALGETTEIPIVFSAVTDPVSAGLVTSMEQPGGNVTGTSDLVPADEIMDLAKEITPGFKTIGALYSSGEINSLSVIEDLKEYAKANGLTVVDAPLMNSSEAQQAAASLVGKADIVFAPIDNGVASTMAIINDTLYGAEIPFYVSADSMVSDGGLATYGISYELLGTETGKMAAQVLKGTDPGTIDIMTFDDYTVYVNTDTAKTLGLTIPQAVLDRAQIFPAN